MGSAERRQQIIELLKIHKQMKMSDLSMRFGVTIRTIQRDVDELSHDYRIVIIRGRHGGVELQSEVKESKPPLTEANWRVLIKLRDAVGREVCHLTDEEKKCLQNTITWIESDYRLIKESGKNR